MDTHLKKDIEKLLPYVSRPSRYINREWNSVHKDDELSRTSMCLCFPDIYELGISNLGIEILYHLINQHQDWVAERSYCPEIDMQDQMRKSNITLSSLESGRPLKSFNIIGISLQYELSYTNILSMLDLAGIPLRAVDRVEQYPLIIGGGPCVSNPEPVAEFFDAFVLGDGEDVVVEIMEWITYCRQKNIKDKFEILRGLSRLPGVYVPSLYQVQYGGDGRLRSITPVDGTVPTVQKRTVDLERSFYPGAPIVPFAHAVHDRLNIEIARGCIHRCRFCQASFMHRPVRERSVEKVLKLTEAGLRATGFENLSLGALSCSDYSSIMPLVEELVRRYAGERISISLPSLRCDVRSLMLARMTRGVKKSSLTFAPEAGTPRMREIINKKMDGENIMAVLRMAHQSGWKHVKLYFMYGLPWEQQEDVHGIFNLVRHAKKESRDLNFNVTISPFVPKAHTPFQWCAQQRPDDLERKRAELIKKIPGNVRAHPIDAAWLEGVFARGDRRLSKVILSAYRFGCCFDQWKERLKADLWRRAFAECSIEPDFYTARERSADEIFPWEHLQYAGSKENLYAEYCASKDVAQGTISSGTSLKPAVINEIPVLNHRAVRNPSVSHPVQRIRLRMQRSGTARFLSHLEQITVFRRIMRRAGLPIAYTQGHHPQPRISFGPAISVGYSSDVEYIDIELIQKVNLEQIRTHINEELPDGFVLLSTRRIPVFFPSLDSVINQVLYRVTGVWPASARDYIDEFTRKKEFWVQKIKKNTKESINLSSVVRNISLTNGSLELLMDFGPKKNIKPTLLIKEIFKIPEKDVESFNIHKVALYIRQHNRRTLEP